MTGHHLARQTGSTRSLVALLASSALFTAGCSNLTSTATTTNPIGDAQTIGGKVHGGSQPVVGATVKLYYAGQSTPATEAATTTTDSNGNFSFTQSATTGLGENGNIYSCPTSSNPLVYVIAKGGNTLNDGISTDVNSAAAFIGVYGDCKNISNSNFILLNEVTTVATMAALQQYFDPTTESVAADGTGSAKIAIDATVNTINNMVNLANGTVVTSTSIPGIHGLNAVTVTATPESSKINLLANILTSCVNNSSSTAANCNTLFASTPAPNISTTDLPGSDNLSTPTDVLQALYYMLANPTSGGSANMATLFGLASGAAAAFQPALATQPTDWTLAISYSATGTCGANNGAFISAPSALAVDLFGDIWIGNGQLGSGNLSEMTAGGVADSCVSNGTGPTVAQSAVFIDSLGNIWSALSGSTSLVQYNPNTSATVAYTAAAPVLAIAGDGSGNIYFSTASSLYEITNGASAASATTPTLVTALANAISLMPDTAGGIWATLGSGSFAHVVGGTPTLYTADADTSGLAVTNSSNIFLSSVTSANEISYFANLHDGNGYVLQSGWPTTSSLGGINQPVAIALDGAKNIWSANNVANSNGLFGISEVSFDGAPLSPDTASGGFQKSSSYLNASSSIIVDQSGNVWVAGGAATNTFITEFVGAGVPIYQPYAEGLKNGRFQLNP